MVPMVPMPHAFCFGFGDDAPGRQCRAAGGRFGVHSAGMGVAAMPTCCPSSACRQRWSSSAAVRLPTGASRSGHPRQLPDGPRMIPREPVEFRQPAHDAWRGIATGFIASAARAHRIHDAIGN